MSEDIERLSQHFREEFATAAHAFFLWKGINNCAAGDREIYRGINEQALSWNTITHSLQTTFFIALGRLFDTDEDAFSVHSYLRSCIDNIDQFSDAELRKRKISGNNGRVPEWLDEYMKDAYVPTANDFQRLRGDLSKRQKQYEEIYRPIRNQIFAHKDADSMETVESLFGKTRIDQIEELLSFLYQIQEVVWQLLMNGRKTSVGDFAFTEEDHVVDDVRELLGRLRLADPLENA
jgi:hypothetical protein